MDIQRLQIAILNLDDKALSVLFDHIANGGSMTEWCSNNRLRYSDVMRMIRASVEHKKQYDAAMIDRQEWAKERVLSEVKSLAMYTLKDLFNEDGSRKKAHELPDDLITAIKEIDADGGIKFQDKTKAIDMFGKQLGLFIEKKELSGTLTLEQMIIAAAASDKAE